MPEVETAVVSFFGSGGDSGRTAILRLSPLDVLYLRGNQLFGGETNHAASLMPPWPSLFAGALRSRMLVDHDISFGDFRAGRMPPDLLEVLGTPEQPGSFRVSWVGLVQGRRLYFPAPSDLLFLAPPTVASDTGNSGALAAYPLEPASLQAHGVGGSFSLPLVPVARGAPAGKPRSGCWLDAASYRAHLAAPGGEIESMGSDRLWKTDHRLGIAMDSHRRTVLEGLLYSTEAVALAPGVDFAVAVSGAEGLLPSSGLLRLGGDGRGADVSTLDPEDVDLPPAGAPWNHVPAGGGFRMVLATPGLFPGGWVPPGVERHDGQWELSWQGLRARLVAAAVGRPETVSGWDLARHAPKPALPAVPAGSVYWFEQLAGDPAVLGILAKEGLWPLLSEVPPALAARRAEGFNQVWFGSYEPESGGR